MILITGGRGQGKKTFAGQLLKEKNLKGIVSMDEMVLEWIENDADVHAQTERLMEEQAQSVFLVSEVGCGLVPVDAKERAYREACGRAGCQLAEQAAEVYRMICGIPQKIK